MTGDDRAVVATIAGRLALAAAADARATLVVDADAEGSSVAGYYEQRPEPGFSDALAGVRLWRDVTRPVGAGDGLSIDVIAGWRDQDRGARPRDAGIRAKRSSRDSATEYDFCVIVSAVGVVPGTDLLARRDSGDRAVRRGGTHRTARLQAHAARHS